MRRQARLEPGGEPVLDGPMAKLTTTRWGLERPELATTLLAVVVSTALYVARGHPYLARGVVGDLIGLGLLSLVVVRRRRRLRHEALLCLFCIAAVLIVDPRWPVRLPGLLWWSLVTAAVVAYLAVRHRLLLRT